MIVSLKYVVIVLRAHDEGEGGTFAVYSLLSRYVRALGIPSERAELIASIAGQYCSTGSEGAAHYENEESQVF